MEKAQATETWPYVLANAQLLSATITLLEKLSNSVFCGLNYLKVLREPLVKETFCEESFVDLAAVARSLCLETEGDQQEQLTSIITEPFN